MKKLYITVLIAVCSLFALNTIAYAQGAAQKRWFDRRKYLFGNQLAWSFNASSAGFGLEGTTALSDKIYLRGGFNIMPGIINFKDEIPVDDNILRARIVDGNSYIPDYHVTFTPELYHGYVLINYHPGAFFKNFHLTAGLYFGISDMKAKGRLKNTATGENTVLKPEYEYDENVPGSGWPTLIVENARLNIDGGVLNATIRMGEIVKPYFGIGFSRSIPKYKNDWGFNWDLGVLIQPTKEIRQGGKRLPTEYQSPAIDISSHLNRVKVWPVMSFRVTYRTK